VKLNTAEIIGRIKQREDREVLNWMYASVYPKVRRYVLSNNGVTEDSKDIFQEAVLVLYKQVVDDKYDQIKDVEGFIITVSRNIWINKAKKLNREVDSNVLEKKSSIEDSPLIQIIMNEKWDAYQRLFDMIGEKCKELLTYSTYEKIPMDEIAVKMNFTSANAAKTHNYRCKQKLIELVTANKELANALKS
jgi:RNA polymerase sigma factor (sigma-70 family)